MFYDQIAGVLLWYEDAKRRKYFTEIWSPEGMKLSITSVSFEKGWREYKDGAYGTLIRELHRRIVCAGAKASFETGDRAANYHPQLIALAVGALVVLAGAIFLSYNVREPGAVLATAVPVFLMLVIALIKLWRNPPGQYEPGSLPGGFVPRAY